jgi:hypothetical protein
MCPEIGGGREKMCPICPMYPSCAPHLVHRSAFRRRSGTAVHLLVDSIWILERLAIVRRHSALNLLYVFRSRQGFRPNAAVQKGFSDCLVVGDMFGRNGAFRSHGVGAGVEDGDFDVTP